MPLTPKKRAVPKEVLESLDVVVIGDNHGWGKAKTMKEAIKLARRPEIYSAYLCHPDSSVSEIDGAIQYPLGYKPVLLFSRGGEKGICNA